MTNMTSMTSITSMTSMRSKEGKPYFLIVAQIAKLVQSGAEIECGNNVFKYSCGKGMIQMANSLVWQSMDYDEWLMQIGNSVQDEYAENIRSGQSWNDVYRRVMRNFDCGNFKFSSLSISMA